MNVYKQDIVQLEDELEKAYRSVTILTNEFEKVNEALQKSERQYRQLMDNASDGIIILDNEGNLADLNSTMLEIIKYTRNEIRNLTTKDIIYPEDYARISRIVNEVRSGKTVQIECRVIRKDGIIITIHISAKKIQDRYIQAIIRDITESKRLEEQLEIRHRMDSLGILAGGIAHDFNNLLTTIIGYIDILELDSEVSEKQKKYIRSAMDTCKQATDLIKQFRILFRSPISQKTSVDIYVIIKDVLNLLEKNTDKLINKKIDFNPGEFHVKANSNELYQVFSNIVTNAVHAIEERGVKSGDYIRIKANNYNTFEEDNAELMEGEYVHIFFEDSGEGMSEENKKRAFAPFFSTKEMGSKKGQGLGLSIVYNIIKRSHNGFVDIESVEGKGSTIHIYLPKAKKCEPNLEQRCDKSFEWNRNHI